MGNTKITGIVYYIALYVRLSKEDGDNEESESIKNQLALLYAFVKELQRREPQNTFIIVDEYIDDGYTGTNFDRPDFIRMLGDIQNKTVNLVISKNLDRFGRYAKEVIAYYQEVFPENNIRFMTALESEVDTSKPEGSVMVLIKAVMAEIYPMNLSTNIKAVKFSKAQQGLFQGNTAPYGYIKSPLDKHKLVVDQNVAPIIRKIFEMYATGYTRHQIVEELNQLKILPPRKHLHLEKGKGLQGVDIEDFSWKECTITKIIKNPVYIGTMVGGKTSKPFFRKKKRITTKKEDLIIVPNTHEPIIDIKLFEKCQEIRSKHLDKTVKYDNLYKGLIFCGNCGKISNLKHKSKPRKDGSSCEILYFLCSEANKGIKKTCSNTKSISAKKLNDLIMPILKKQCNAITVNKEDIEKLTRNINDNFTFELERLEKEKVRYEEKIKTIKNQIKQVYNDKLENKITDDLFQEVHKDKQLEIEQYIKLLDEVEEKLQQEKNKEVISYQEVLELSNEFINSDVPSKELMSKLVKRIEFDSNRNLNVQFTFADMLKEVC